MRPILVSYVNPEGKVVPLERVGIKQEQLPSVVEINSCKLHWRRRINGLSHLLPVKIVVPSLYLPL